MSSTEADPLDALVRTSFLVMGVLSRVAAAHDLSLTQLRVLGILRDRSLRMAELADYLGLERSTLSGLVDRAERRGLLERVKDPDDGRAVVVRTTTSARREAAKVEGEIRRALLPQTDRLGARDLATLARLLGEVAGPQPGPASSSR